MPHREQIISLNPIMDQANRSFFAPKTCWNFSWTLGWLDLEVESSPPLFVFVDDRTSPGVSKIGSPLLRVEWTVVVLFAIALELAAGRK
jgi:hypothetical protein